MLVKSTPGGIFEVFGVFSGSMDLDFSALSPPNSIVSEELSNGGYSSPFQLSPMSSNLHQQHVPSSNQEKVRMPKS
jgi:hypothetical protein